MAASTIVAEHFGHGAVVAVVPSARMEFSAIITPSRAKGRQEPLILSFPNENGKRQVALSAR